MTALSTREKLIQIAHDLFYSDGFHAVGLDRIISRVGVTKTTFYNHFESKDDLILAALQMHDKWWRDEFQRLLRKHGGDAPRDQLLAAADAIEELFVWDGFKGCIFINVAVEFPLPHDPAHIAAAAHKRAMGDLIQEIAGYAGAEDPAAFAQQMSLILEGSYVTRQVTGDQNTAAHAKRLIQLLVDHHIPPRR
ncbi:MAG: TetR/AcrR family transcriptional regulator [Planctomycetota bacterium]|nr:TetR/AcrR family transcriptional regulator [Planctomycetota bacterium]